MKTILAVLLMAILAVGTSALELSGGGGLSVGAVCDHGAREAHLGNCAALFLGNRLFLGYLAHLKVRSTALFQSP